MSFAQNQKENKKKYDNFKKLYKLVCCGAIITARWMFLGEDSVSSRSHTESISEFTMLNDDTQRTVAKNCNQINLSISVPSDTPTLSHVHTNSSTFVTQLSLNKKHSTSMPVTPDIQVTPTTEQIESHLDNGFPLTPVNMEIVYEEWPVPF